MMQTASDVARVHRAQSKERNRQVNRYSLRAEVLPSPLRILDVPCLPHDVREDVTKWHAFCPRELFGSAKPMAVGQLR